VRILETPRAPAGCVAEASLNGRLHAAPIGNPAPAFSCAREACHIGYLKALAMPIPHAETPVAAGRCASLKREARR
jgi:hypothetical protein